jgi:pilus assembly protein Flp/PilA
MNTLRELIFEEDGAAAAEYALILAIIGSAIAVAAVLLGTNIGTAEPGCGRRGAASRATDPWR